MNQARPRWTGEKLRSGADLLFGLLTDRYERGSVLVTSNLDFASWTEVFGDPRLTAALMDRLTAVRTGSHRPRQDRQDSDSTGQQSPVGAYGRRAIQQVGNVVDFGSTQCAMGKLHHWTVRRKQN